MKRFIFIITLVSLVFSFYSCSSKKSDDPISTIEALSEKVSSSGDDWDEGKWEQATDELSDALDNLPEPLEVNEKITLESALSAISIVANMHERKAAKMIELISTYNNDKVEVVEEVALNESYDLGGAVDKYPITMHLDIEGTQVKGTYFYNKRGPNAKLNLSGTFEDGEMDLNETDEKGTPTGHFKGAFEGGEYKGQFYDNKGKSMNFLVTESGVSVDEVLAAFEGELPDDFESVPDDGEDIDFDDIDDDSPSDSNIDKFLDDYEKFMNDYIACMKKMANEDPTALLNYGKMLARYEKLAKEGDRIKGKMTTKQLQKLNNISLKISKALESLPNN